MFHKLIFLSVLPTKRHLRQSIIKTNLATLSLNCIFTHYQANLRIHNKPSSWIEQRCFNFFSLQNSKIVVHDEICNKIFCCHNEPLSRKITSQRVLEMYFCRIFQSFAPSQSFHPLPYESFLLLLLSFYFFMVQNVFRSDTKKTLDYYLHSHRHGKSEAQGWCWLWNWQNNIFNALQASSELALSEKVSSSHLPWTNNCIRCYLCQFFSQFSSCIVIFICFHPFFMFFILSWIYRWKYLRILVSSLCEFQWFNEIHFARLAEKILGRLLNFR